MKPSALVDTRLDGIVVVECPIHRLFHVGPKTDLTPGPPPQLNDPKCISTSSRSDGC
jgi:hypothetical protein